MELEPTLAANQGETGSGMVWRRRGEDSGQVRAEEKQGLLVRRKKNNLRFLCRINFQLNCPDGKIGCGPKKLSEFSE